MKIDENLIKRYNSGHCTTEEQQLVEEWYLSYEGKEKLDSDELESGLSSLDKLMEPLLEDSTSKKSSFSFFRYAYVLRIAAALVLVGSFAFLFYLFNKQETALDTIAYKVETPTGSRTIISLDNGETLHLDSLHSGRIYSTDHFTIELMEDGELKYTSNGKQTGKQTFNTIQAAIGGFVRLSLPDGTKVWLNSASKLTYPAVFSSYSREVQLEGEAYFEVSRTKENRPFIVRTDTDIVEVIGTQFNVNAYPEDETRKISLIEGKVAVYSNSEHFDGETKQADVILVPGQQYIRKGELVNIVKPISITSVVDWKNGYFTFSENSFEDIAKKISRWYGVEINYKYDIPQEIYYGEISRQKDITTVLELLAAVSNVHFELIGNKVIITYHNLD